MNPHTGDASPIPGMNTETSEKSPVRGSHASTIAGAPRPASSRFPRLLPTGSRPARDSRPLRAAGDVRVNLVPAAYVAMDRARDTAGRARWRSTCWREETRGLTFGCSISQEQKLAGAVDGATVGNCEQMQLSKGGADLLAFQESGRPPITVHATQGRP